MFQKLFKESSMRILLLTAGTLASALLVGCNDQPVHPVYVPPPEDPAAYKPIPAPKPMPPSAGGEAQPQPVPQPLPAPALPPAGSPPPQ